MFTRSLSICRFALVFSVVCALISCTAESPSGSDETNAQPISSPTPSPAQPIPAPAQPAPAPQAPAMPQAVSAAAAMSRVQVAWVYASNVDSFRIERQQDGEQGWLLVNILPGTERSYEDAQVLAGTSYRYRVIATLAGLDSQPSTEALVSVPMVVSVATPYVGLGQGVPGRVQAEFYDNGGSGIAYNDTTLANTGGTFRTTDSVDLVTSTDVDSGLALFDTAAGEWCQYSLNVPTAGAYSLAVRISNVDAAASISLVIDGKAVATNVGLPITGLNQWLSLEVASVDLSAGKHFMQLQIGAGNFTLNYFEFSTVVGIPAKPENLTAQSVDVPGDKSIYLRWEDNSSNEKSFDVERAAPGGEWLLLANVVQNSEFYRDANATKQNGYSYRVRARNTQGASEYSNVFSFSEPPVGTPAKGKPNAPLNVTAMSLDDQMITVQWIDATYGSATAFIVERQDNGGAWNTLAMLPKGSKSFMDNGVQMNVNYNYRVTSGYNDAMNNLILSDVSNAYTIRLPIVVSQAGASTYSSRCASCHGAQGQGSGAYPYPVKGCLSCKDLNYMINTTEFSMPPGNPASCVDDCAKDVGEFMVYQFNR